MTWGLFLVVRSFSSPYEWGLEPIQLSIKNHNVCLGDGAGLSALFEMCFSQVLLRLGGEAGETQSLSGFRENPPPSSRQAAASSGLKMLPDKSSGLDGNGHILHRVWGGKGAGSPPQTHPCLPRSSY